MWVGVSPPPPKHTHTPRRPKTYARKSIRKFQGAYRDRKTSDVSFGARLARTTTCGGRSVTLPSSSSLRSSWSSWSSWPGKQIIFCYSGFEAFFAPGTCNTSQITIVSSTVKRRRDGTSYDLLAFLVLVAHEWQDAELCFCFVCVNDCFNNLFCDVATSFVRSVLQTLQSRLHALC